MTTPEEASDNLSPSHQSARETARRLISARRPERPGDDTPARLAAAAGDHLYGELSRWLGRDGCHALFTRALADAAIGSPALKQIQLRARTHPYIDGVPETIMAHGDAATAEGLEWMLVRLVELLGRLIGDDMSMKLIERSVGPAQRGSTSGRKQEEA